MNGPSSSGKTSLAHSLQSALTEPYLHIGIDTLIGMMPEKCNDWSGKKISQGFWWNLSHDKHGNPLAHIQLEPYAKHISSTLKEIVVTMANAWHNLIIDEICISPGRYEEWRQVLSPYNTLYVGIVCHTESLKIREKNEKRPNHRIY